MNIPYSTNRYRGIATLLFIAILLASPVVMEVGPPLARKVAKCLAIIIMGGFVALQIYLPIEAWVVDRQLKKSRRP